MVSAYHHIIRSAGSLLAAEGYAGTTIRAVQRRSGVGPGTLYYHFPSYRFPSEGHLPNAESRLSPRDQIVHEALTRALDLRTFRLSEDLLLSRISPDAGS